MHELMSVSRKMLKAVKGCADGTAWNNVLFFITHFNIYYRKNSAFVVSGQKSTTSVGVIDVYHFESKSNLCARHV